MNQIFPVTHSVLSTEALLSELLPSYDIGAVQACKLLNKGLNDTYLVKSQDEQYILRVYRSGWRSQTDILYELDVLLHLKKQGIAVSYPLMRRDGRLIHTVLAPEGERPIVLFSYAPGKEPNYEVVGEEQNYRYGKSAAQIHLATDGFHNPHQRFALDLAHLLDKPMISIHAVFGQRSEDWAYLQALAERLRQAIGKLPQQALEWGFCHGDFHGGNVHVSADGTHTFFDFDCCGEGWRAYDIAVYRWGTNWDGKGKERWQHFLRGYQEVRPISEVEMQAVNLFVPVRQFWLMGLHTSNGADWGFGWMNDWYFKHALKVFQDWEAEQTTENPT